MLRKVPLIVILGSTGTGKTKLSLELAEYFGGEIISADAMQVYANLDIATAKVTKEEQSRAKHHLLDIATTSIPFNVFQFRNKALPIIESLLRQSKCPIVVGGTNYYIESLLWDILINTSNSTDKDECNNLPTHISDTVAAETTHCQNIDDTVSAKVENLSFTLEEKVLTIPSESLHNHLRNIDPVTANRLHPNNKRKIIRAIEFYQQTGQTISSKLNEQRQQPGSNRLGGPLRYPHTILLWLTCNQDVLNQRLDKRVDAMLQQGLLREIRAFYNEHIVNSSTSAFTKGVLQTIGFKEFIPYLDQFEADNDINIEMYLQANAYKMPTEEQFKLFASPKNEVKSADNSSDLKGQIPQGLELLNSCLNQLKLVTRRYSKKQIKWINNRILGSKDRLTPDMYELDTSDVNQWHQKVLCPAKSIIDCYRNEKACEIEAMQKKTHPSEGLNEETSKFCSICERHFIGEYQWGIHMKSNKHKKRKESLRKKLDIQTVGDSKSMESH